MKYYGNLNLNQNELQNAVLPVDTYFPVNPKVGQLVFKNKVLYICVDIQNGLPVWTPLTNEIDTYLHNEPNPSALWTITHNLNSGTVQVQIFDNVGRMIIPNEIEIVDNNSVTVSFGVAVAGRAIVMIGSLYGNEKPSYGYEHTQTSLSDTWVVNHALGYYPIVRVFIGNEEVQPASITHNDNFTTTITFTQPYVGSAKFI